MREGPWYAYAIKRAALPIHLCPGSPDKLSDSPATIGNVLDIPPGIAQSSRHHRSIVLAPSQSATHYHSSANAESLSHNRLGIIAAHIAANRLHKADGTATQRLASF